MVSTMAAAALPHVDVTKPQQVIGTNTVACMQSGVFWGYVGLVKEICARIKAERERDMQVIATGGLAPLFQQSVRLFSIAAVIDDRRANVRSLRVDSVSEALKCVIGRVNGDR